MKQLTLIIGPGGAVTTLYDERLDLHRLGSMQVRRAGHVEPVDVARPGAPTGWRVSLAPVKGPTFGPFASRSAALAAERGWLERHLPELAADT
ncbi:hypothetical protein ACERK3_16260 [Phycisphaerales bacterium AB-hyl4]|uniref:Uncharacterized protein n=1 Tax=Natronomicrosphaera hydrolytica TaxID=3242702 RepID=A0ABV4U9Z9_9BACT